MGADLQEEEGVGVALIDKVLLVTEVNSVQPSKEPLRQPLRTPLLSCLGVQVYDSVQQAWAPYVPRQHVCVLPEQPVVLEALCDVHQLLAVKHLAGEGGVTSVVGELKRNNT